jgi:hypothetical protein
MQNTMQRKDSLRRVVTSLACLGSIAVSPLANSITGPSSSGSPYIVRAQPGVVTVSLLTAGDAVNFKEDGVTPYRMVGIPDGLGAFDNGDGTFTVLMNHELRPERGVIRDHGAIGAFVSKWVIDKENMSVLHGEDLIKHVWLWNTDLGYQETVVTFNRFCSADLPPITAFFDPLTSMGYEGLIYLNGEESGADGRAFAHLLDGNSYELPALGNCSWENVVAHPAAGARTVVVGLDDSGEGQVYVYVGNKQATGSAIERAGLANGKLHGLKVSGMLNETDSSVVPDGTSFSLVEISNAIALNGAQIEAASDVAEITGFQRPEDGAWDPSNPNDFYFVTTASFAGKSRLWRLRFTDASNPTLGGSVAMVLEGTEGQKMMDNLTISSRGSVLIQEDVGANAHLGKILRYSIAQDQLEVIAEHDANRFLPGGANFLTIDEESSGIIPMENILGEGWYLLDVQAHYNIGDPELVEGGQLLLLHFPPGREK